MGFQHLIIEGLRIKVYKSAYTARLVKYKESHMRSV